MIATPTKLFTVANIFMINVVFVVVVVIVVVIDDFHDVTSRNVRWRGATKSNESNESNKYNCEIAVIFRAKPRRYKINSKNKCYLTNLYLTPIVISMMILDSGQRTNRQKKTQIVASTTCQNSNKNNNANVYGCPCTGWKYRQ